MGFGQISREVQDAAEGREALIFPSVTGKPEMQDAAAKCRKSQIKGTPERTPASINTPLQLLHFSQQRRGEPPRQQHHSPLIAQRVGILLGHDPAVAEREADIERLQRLVWDAIYALQKAGLDKEAAKLRHLLERR